MKPNKEMFKDKNIRRGRLIAINIFVIVFMLLLCYVLPINSINEYYAEKYESEEDYQYFIYGSNYVMQSFELNTSGVNNIEIPVTYKNDYGFFSIKLLDNTGNIVEEFIINKADYADEDEWIDCKLESALNPKTEYTILIEAPELNERTAVSIRGKESLAGLESNKDFVYIKCFISEINGYNEGCIYLALSKEYVNFFAILSFVILIVALNIAILLKEEVSGNKAFVLIMLYGIIMLSIMSPGSGADERFHYNCTARLANVLLGNENVTFIDEALSFDYDMHYNTNSNFLSVINGLGKKTIGDNNTKKTLDAVNTQPVAVYYIPQAIGFSIGVIFKLNGVTCYMLARLFNLIVYSIMMAMALKIIPINKDLMLVFALNPMALHQASQLSYDGVILSSMAIYMAYVIRLIYNEHYITGKDVVCLSVLLSIAGLQKPVYYVFFAFMVLVPSKNYKTMQDKVLKLGLCVMLLLSCAIGYALFLDYSIVNQITQNSVQMGSGVLWEKGIGASGSDYYSVSGFFNEPIGYITIIIRTILLKGPQLLKESVGARLAGLSVEISEYVTMTYFAVLLLSSNIGKSKKEVFNRKTKIYMMLIVFIEIVAITASGFLMTYDGMEVLQGLQGRYYTACLLPTFIVIGDLGIIKKTNRRGLHIMISLLYIVVIHDVMSKII